MPTLSVTRIWRFLPIAIVGTRRLPQSLIGVCLGPIVLVSREYVRDQPTLIHELEHSKQFFKGGLIVHFVRYWLSTDYRLKVEAQAFAAEIAACPSHIALSRFHESARALSCGYGLSLTCAQCEVILLGYLNPNVAQN
jgi:hypothetical protein